jgi:glutaredoxin-like YruB-family protein
MTAEEKGDDMYRFLSTTLVMFLSLGILYGTSRAANTASPNQTILDQTLLKKASYPKIVIYTVAWCPHCRELKEYLTARKIPFSNHDVEVEAGAMEELTQKYKSQGVPLVVFGNDQEVLKGFTPETFERAAAKALAIGR